MKYEITVSDNENDQLKFYMIDDCDSLYIATNEDKDLLQIEDANRFIDVLKKLTAMKEQQS